MIFTTLIRGARARSPRLLLLAFLLGSSTAQAQTPTDLRVIKENAIPFTRFLSKADFDQRFPGERLTDVAQLDIGWYVIYQHESINYYFGPILLESTGQDYLEQLKATVGNAVTQRPSIEGYRLELSYEPQVSPQPNNPSNPPESNEPSSFPSAPPPPPSIFDFFKRLFGFR